MEEFLRPERLPNAPAKTPPNVGVAESLAAKKKTTPVRRLTVDRKPLRTHRSLAQAPISGNGLYSTSGHLVETDRLPHEGRVLR